ICEIVGGYLAGSISVMSDAAHMLSDCGGFALALLAFRCAARPPNANMSYGYRRAVSSDKRYHLVAEDLLLLTDKNNKGTYADIKDSIEFC
ncbi:jg13965, partial [Pararge aegeria aegeria]